MVMAAGVCKAAADVVADHYDHSIFTNNPQWWNKEISWKNKYVDGEPGKGFKNKFLHPQTFSDGWHTANFFMLLCFFLCALSLALSAKLGLSYWLIGVWFIAAGSLFVLTFNTFYNHIFVKHEKK